MKLYATYKSSTKKVEREKIRTYFPGEEISHKNFAVEPTHNKTCLIKRQSQGCPEHKYTEVISKQHNIVVTHVDFGADCLDQIPSY